MAMSEWGGSSDACNLKQAHSRHISPAAIKNNVTDGRNTDWNSIHASEWGYGRKIDWMIDLVDRLSAIDWYEIRVNIKCFGGGGDGGVRTLSEVVDEEKDREKEVVESCTRVLARTQNY